MDLFYVGDSLAVSLAVATIIESGATMRRLAPLVAHRKRGHLDTTCDFALEGLFQKWRVGERMLTVEDYALIRRKPVVDKQSIRAIAKELGHSRKTVANAARRITVFSSRASAE